jgi:hypothetical protein
MIPAKIAVAMPFDFVEEPLVLDGSCPKCIGSKSTKSLPKPCEIGVSNDHLFTSHTLDAKDLGSRRPLLYGSEFSSQIEFAGEPQFSSQTAETPVLSK